jgi:hypothetical protein
MGNLNTGRQAPHHQGEQSLANTSLPASRLVQRVGALRAALRAARSRELTSEETDAVVALEELLSRLLEAPEAP